MDLNFCNLECKKGREEINKFLINNNSAYDAFIDFKCFVEECVKTCPYRENICTDSSSMLGEETQVIE